MFDVLSVEWQHSSLLVSLSVGRLGLSLQSAPGEIRHTASSVIIIIIIITNTVNTVPSVTTVNTVTNTLELASTFLAPSLQEVV